MLSLSRAPGESIELFVDYVRDPRLVALVRRLGGNTQHLAGLTTQVTIQYTHTASAVNGVRLAQPEAFLALDAPRHVEIWRTEKLSPRDSA